MAKKPAHIERPGEPQRAAGASDGVLEHREAWVRAREVAADARESAADSREIELAGREELARLREEALKARAEADEIRAERERLLAQVRAANEKLVIAAMTADEMVETASYNELRFRSLVTTSAAIVWYATASGDVRVDADTWRSFTGGAVPESGWLDSVHPKDRDHVREAWQRAVASSTPYACQHRIQKADGSYAWVVARGVPIRRAGVVQEWIGMMTDVTDRVRIEEAREQFIGILGHDLRNPVTAVTVGMDMLGGIGEPYAPVIQRISRSARRMEVIIRDVMDFARGRLSGGIPVTLGSCDIGRIGSDVVNEMKQAHPDRDLEIEATGDLIGECDAARVEQVLSNLIGNAMTHGTDPIRVKLVDEGDEIVMAVHNHGAPIPSAMVPRLFEPYSRGLRDTHARDGAEGLGLGLYIVSEIVRAHGGRVTVDSAEAGGTTFTIRWPRSPAARARLPKS